MLRFALGIGVVWSLAGASPAEATMTINLSGLAGTGVTANVDFTYHSYSDTSAKIILAITNTTPWHVGGVITGFAFNVPTLPGVTITKIGGDVDDVGTQRSTKLGSPNERGWWARFDPDHINTPEGAGYFDVGVNNKKHANAFISGGSLSWGASNIHGGETDVFKLSLMGTGLDNFTNADFENAFLSALSVGGPAGAFSFGARFRDLCRRDSDLAVYVKTQTAMVPVPSAALLSLLGLGGAGVLRRRGVSPTA